MKTFIPSVKGARDFYPAELYARNWLYGIIRRVSERFGYQEWDGPFLEKIDLYAAKSGEELVKKQSFVFPDRGGDLIALRPELTPSLARMVAQRQNELAFPLRWWSFGPFWRYEQPQRGRTREFFQWNIDLIGVDSPEADAELVSIGAEFMQQAGLPPDEVVIRVNDRRLVDQEMRELGVSGELRSSVFHLIDRRDKMQPDAWETYAGEIGLDDSQLARLKDMLANPNLWEKSVELRRFFTAIDALDARPYVCYDPSVIRGLDYYTGVVFEAADRKQPGRAILGGGRYDNLVNDVGGRPVPATGFAMGDVMISVILKERGLLPLEAPNPAVVLVTVFDETRLPRAFRLGNMLRKAGIPAAVYPEPARMQKQLKYADKTGIRWVVIAGPDEEAQGNVTLKDLSAGEQVTIPEGDLTGWIQGKLAQLR